jgi:hypothetical protein
MWGRAAYEDDPDKFEVMVKQNFPKPTLQVIDAKLVKLQD